MGNDRMDKITPIKKPESSTSFDRRVARADARIRHIAWSRPWAFGGPWSDYRLEMMLARPLSEKEAFLRRATFIPLGVLAVIAGLTASAYFNHEPAPAPKIGWQDAGVVQEITLHSTTFATESTVRTSVGVFQVHGGVSAAAGDKARIKRDGAKSTAAVTETSLCIESEIKTECYRLL